MHAGLGERMIASKIHIRNELLPGLSDWRTQYLADAMAQTWEMHAARVLNGVFVPSKPHIWVPRLSLPEAALVGAAAAVIKNPVVSRRFWSGWVNE